MTDRSIAVLVVWGLLGLIGMGSVFSVVIEISDGNFLKATLSGVVAVLMAVIFWRYRSRPT